MVDTDLAYVATWVGVGDLCSVTEEFSRMCAERRVALRMRTSRALMRWRERWLPGAKLRGVHCQSEVGSCLAIHPAGGLLQLKSGNGAGHYLTTKTLMDELRQWRLGVAHQNGLVSLNNKQLIAG